MVACAVCLALLTAAPPITLAAPGLTSVGIEPGKVEFFSERSAQAVSVAGLRVVAARDIATALGFERQKQLLGCSEEASACAAELGNALGAAGILVGNLALLEGRFEFNLKVINPKDSLVIATRSGNAPTELSLLDGLDQAGRELAVAVLQRFGRTEEAALVLQPGATLRSRSWIPLVVGAVLAGAGAGLFGASLGPRDQLTTARLSLTEAASARDLGSTLQTTGVVAISVGAAALLAGGAMAVFGGPRPVQASLWVTPAGAGVGLAGVLP